MRRAGTIAAICSISMFLPTILSAQTHRAGELALEPGTFRTYDGAAHPAETGHLWVRQDRSGPSDRLVELAFVRLKTEAAHPEPPVVFLAGGPGVPGIGMGQVPVYYELFAKVQAFADVILFDQRGTGLSSPNSQCPQGPAPPADVFESEKKLVAAIVERGRACTEYWRGKGLDQAAFSTAASADDLDDLRQALGAAKISLIGHSYGTNLALEMMDRHPGHVGRVVLAAVEGPWQALKLPLTYDFGLRRLSEMAAAAPDARGAFPDTYQTLQRVLADLDREPLNVSIAIADSKLQRDLKVGSFLVRFALMQMMPNGRRADHIPAVVESLAHRDPSLIAGAVADLYGNLRTGFSAMQFEIYCNDGWSEGRRKTAEEQATHSIFGDAPFAYLDPRMCGDARSPGSLGDALRPFWNAAPALIVSGTLDSDTPAYQAQEVAWGLPNAETVSVVNGFHETLPDDNVQAAVVDFLRGGDVGHRTITFSAPHFLSIEEAKTPARRH